MTKIFWKCRFSWGWVLKSWWSQEGLAVVCVITKLSSRWGGGFVYYPCHREWSSFAHLIEIVGVFPQFLFGETSVLRIVNREWCISFNPELMDMRIDLILTNPWPKGLVGVILLLVKVLYLKRKGAGTLSPSHRCSRVLGYSKEWAWKRSSLFLFTSKRTFSSTCLWS